MLIRDGDGGKGGEKVKAQLRTLTQKTEEAMDHCQNNGNVKAVSPCHCCFNCYAGHQKRTHPTYQAHSVTLVCTGIRQNPILLKTGHSLLILKLVQHINTQIHTFTC